MNKQEFRREESIAEAKEDEYRENNEREFCVHFKGMFFVDALDKEEAIARAKDQQDLIDYVDAWEADY